jgi:hypothetical protein
MLFADNLAAGPRLSIGHGFGLYSAQKRYHRAAEQVNMTGSQAGLRFPFPRNSRVMAKNFTSRGISAGFRAVVIKALPNSRRGNHV